MIRMFTLSKLNARGLTLIELLIVMGLLSGFLVILVTLFTATIDTQTDTETYTAVSADGRFIMSRLDYDIARATAIVTPASLSASCSTSLQLTIGTTFAYAVNATTLQLNQNDSNGAINLNSDGSSISNVCFQRIGNSTGDNTIRYSFTLTSAANGANNTVSQTFTSTAGLR